MDVKDDNGRLEIELPMVLDLPAASELRDILVDALAHEGGPDVVLKAAGVERAATAAIQVMVAGAAAFAGAARRLEVDAPSDAFAAVFRHLGLSADLDKLVLS